MHELLHVVVLVASVAGVAALALLLLWPLVAEAPLPRATGALLWALVAAGTAAFLLEWLVVH